jgi:integrase
LIVSSALSQAVKWQLIPRSVAPLATLPKTEPRALSLPTIEEISRLVEACAESDPVLSAAIILATLTGARRGELLALRWSDIDRQKLTLTIGRSVTRGAGGERLIGATKTYTVRRLSIDKSTLLVLDAHRTACEATAADGGLELGDQAFVLTWDPSGQTAANPEVLTSRFARLTKQVGCPQVRFHDLRHAVATTLLAQGYDLGVVAGRLGHSSPIVTLRVYTHALEMRDRQAAGVMGGLLGLPAGVP